MLIFFHIHSFWNWVSNIKIWIIDLISYIIRILQVGLGSSGSRLEVEMRAVVFFFQRRPARVSYILLYLCIRWTRWRIKNVL